MQVNVIKREIPAAISEQGGAQVIIVGKETVELETSIAEAQDGLYVIGDKLLIKGFFVGLMKSMIDGVQRDGHARQLADFLTVYPVVTGEFDLDAGWRPEMNGVKIRVRLMNEMTLDISGWEFVDVTPGRQPFKLESVKAGDVLGVVQLGEPVEINGKPLPLTGAIRIDWAVEGTDKSGTIPAAKVTSTVSRADILGDALDELKSATYDGKTIVFTVRGNFANAKISGLLKYVAPAPTITKIATPGKDGIVKGEAFDIEGTNLRYNEGDSVKVKWTAGTPGEQLLAPTAVTPTKMSFAAVSGFDALPDNTELTFEVTIDETKPVATTILIGA